MNLRTCTLIGIGILATSAMGQKPKILLVHGAFADGSSWSQVAQILQKRGYEVEALQNDLHSLSADVEHTRSRIAAQKGPTVVVGHSYGGAVISGAASEAPNAKALVFVSAFVPDREESLASLTSQGAPSPLMKEIQPDPTGHLYLSRAGFIKYFANGVKPGVAAALAASQRPIAGAAWGEKLAVEPAWKKLPCWYAVTRDDQVLPAGAQAQFAQRCRAKSVRQVPAGHAAMITQPNEIAQIILEAAKSVEGK